MKQKKRLKKKFSLKRNYKRSWEYIRDSRKFIFAIIGIFLLFLLVGLFIPAPDSVYKWISDYVQKIAGSIEGLSTGGLISFIFFNNLQSSFFGLVLGTLLGIFPIFVALFNGYILGFVLNASIDAGGIIVIWRLLPHGIFELPAVFISLGLGLRIGANLLFRRKKNGFRNNLYNSLRVFLFIVLPLLLIAAIIESILIVLVN
ncbi:MAG: stage II sporulation protein M [Candidatus Nanoarchaeia archaeon]|nr:stage II sporulation protein M [Candidatus Nanoarchaeia archaeon]